MQVQIPLTQIRDEFIEQKRVAFLDIETTGLSRYTDDITMIGIYDGEEQHLFIKGKNLREAHQKLREFDIIVTFNGKQFDMPFIEHHFNEKYEYEHLDLRFLLKEFGLKGGLKSIEKELGINRPEEIANLDGREAVKLWRQYLSGNQRALGLLVKYNREDIINLKTLLDWYIEKKIKND